jgi:hypothetical protein
MAFVHGKNTKVLTNEFDWSAYFNSTDIAYEVDVPESTTFGNSDRTYIAGLRTGTMSLAGFFDALSDTDEDVVPGQLGQVAVVLVTVAPDGFTIGNRTYSAQGRWTGRTITSPVDGIVTTGLDVQATAGVDRGVSLHNLTSETSSGNGSSVDNAAASSNGATAFLHITAWNATTLDVKVEDSINDSVWADHITFAQASGITSERGTSTGTVDRYARLNWTLVGTSATFAVSFTRL